MKEYRLLQDKLTDLLPWHQARIKFLAFLILGLLKAQTVNYMKLACKVPGQAKILSKYKRVQRFFRWLKMDFALFAKAIVKLMPLPDKWVLCLDRTNWKLGKTHINILVLGVSYHGFCIPLFWTVLNKAGNTHTKERIQVMQRFLDVFSADKIATLTGDREFIGKAWIQYLIYQRIPFCIRVKKNTKVTKV